MFKKIITTLLLAFAGMPLYATPNAYFASLNTVPLNLTVASETPVLVNTYNLLCPVPATGCSMENIMGYFNLANNGATRGVIISMKVEKSTQSNGVYDVVVLPLTQVGTSSATNIITGATLSAASKDYTTGTMRISFYAALNGNPTGTNPVLTSILMKYGYASNTSDFQDVPVAPSINMPNPPNGANQNATLTAPYRKSGSGQIAMDAVTVRQFWVKTYKLTTVFGTSNYPVLVATKSYGHKSNFVSATTTAQITYPSEGTYYNEFYVEDIAGKMSLAATSANVNVLGTFAAPTITSISCPPLMAGATTYGTAQYTAAPTMRDGSAIVTSRYKGIKIHAIYDGTTDLDYFAAAITEAWTNSSVIKSTNALLGTGSYRLKICSLDTGNFEGACATSAQKLVVTPTMIGVNQYVNCSVQ